MTKFLVISVVVISIILTNGVVMAASDRTGLEKDGLVIRSFDTLYEPSAVVSLVNGEVMVFEDEGHEIVSVHRLVEDEDGLLLRKVESSLPSFEVRDVEGAALGRNNTVVAITSHSKNQQGERKGKREKLIFFNPHKHSAPQVVSGKRLKKAITQKLASIDKSLQETSGDLNIEGLSFTADGKSLLIGLRDPVYKGSAMIVELTNPYTLTSKKYSPQLSSKPILLGLGGAGVRALTYDKGDDQYFVVSEVKTKKKRMRPRLWTWKKDKNSIVRVSFNGLKRLKNIEGITVVQHKQKSFLLLVCDDGEKEKGKGASYALIDIDNISPHK